MATGILPMFIFISGLVLFFLLLPATQADTRRRRSLPQGAPVLLNTHSWPVLGALRFFSHRYNFYLDCLRATRSGSFTFFIGSYPIVGLSGLEGRKTLFETKGLGFGEAYSVLFANLPPGSEDVSSFNNSIRILAQMIKTENIIKMLPLLISDARSQLGLIAAGATTTSTWTGGACPQSEARTGIIDPFHDIYRAVFRMMMRAIGPTEIVESPALLGRTMYLLQTIEAPTSPTRIIFPWLPTPAHLRRLLAGGRLYMIFNRIVSQRNKAAAAGGRGKPPPQDPLQTLLDGGKFDLAGILAFEIGSLFAGVIYTGTNAAWLLVYLATNRAWLDRVRAEVDSVVGNHQTSPSQTPADVLAALPFEAWESSFPSIELALRECIRIQTVGCALRRNTSGRDLPITGSSATGTGGSNEEVIPAGAFAAYLVSDIYMDPAVYAEPERWDPSRFLPDRAEDKKAGHLGFVGWGAGRHPCLGMRFAKIEVAVITALFIAMFEDFEATDPNGNRLDEPPPANRRKHSSSKPEMEVRLRYTLRC